MIKKNIFNGKNVPKARCLHERKCETYKTKCAVGQILRLNPDGYGVALVSRIDKIIGLFCKRAL